MLHTVDQLSLRGFNKSLQRRIRQTATERKLSLNRAALLLLERGAAADERAVRQPMVVGNALDEFIGSWSKEQERELLVSLKPLNRIDRRFWR